MGTERLTKKIAATLGNREGLTAEENRMVTDMLYRFGNKERVEAMGIVRYSSKYGNIFPERKLELLKFAGFLDETCVPMFVRSLVKPMEFRRVIRRLFREDTEFTAVGWDVYWYAQIRIRDDDTADLYINASAIIGGRYVASIIKEPWMKDGMIPFLFYTDVDYNNPGKKGHPIFPDTGMKFEDGYSSSYHNAIKEET